MFLDADEMVSPELRAEIEALKARDFGGGEYTGFEMPRNVLPPRNSRRNAVVSGTSA